jgi:pimeloyl-ACP methyl ester carboxylesterase
LAGQDSKFITVNGDTIHYVKSGSGKPVVLVHGFGLSTYSWRKLIPLLADRYTVYAPDLLGFGLSDKPPDGNYDLKSHGDLVIGFMDALKLSSAPLVGHSMGGIVVSYAANKAPSRVDKLVIIEPGFYRDTAPPFLKYLFFPLPRIMAKQFYARSSQERLHGAMFYDKSLLTDETLEAYMAAGRTPNVVDALTAMMQDVGPQKYEGISEKISVSTLIVWGESDERPLSEEAKRLKREIKGSQLMLIRDSGHLVPEEKPRDLASLIRDFLG